MDYIYNLPSAGEIVRFMAIMSPCNNTGSAMERILEGELNKQLN
jgi:hypothetical protein